MLKVSWVAVVWAISACSRSTDQTAAGRIVFVETPDAVTRFVQADFAFTVSGGAMPEAFVCTLDSQPAAYCQPRLRLGVIGDGTHVLRVAAIASPPPQPAAYSWQLDTTQPTTIIESAPAARMTEATATFAFRADEPATWTCALDGGDPTACVSPWILRDLVSGPHSVIIRAHDIAGNEESPGATGTWTIDLPPETWIRDTVPSPTESTAAAITFDGSDDHGVAAFECRWDRGVYTTCTSPAEADGLAEGDHEFAVRAVDDAGTADPTPATTAWTVDFNLPPDTTLTARPSAQSPLTVATIIAASPAVDLAGFRCSVDGAPMAPCPARLDLQGLVAGMHTVSVSAIDTRGAVDPSPAYVTWTVVGAAATWATVAVGSQHACAIRADGSLWCWGANAYGKLGIGSSADATSPTRVGSAMDWLAIDVGRHHSCGLRSGGSLWCWGSNLFGQVGDGSGSDVSVPTQIGFGTTWAVVHTGTWHSCALDVTGGAWCWGYNASGRLGDGTSVDRSTPTAVASAQAYTTIGAGGAHSCALRASGVVDCWGANAEGQVGDGTWTARNSPVPVAGTLGTMVTLAVGGAHNCALAADGRRWCWGEGANGQLGNGAFAAAAAPTDTGDSAQAVVAGGSHTCLIDAGALFCAGANAGGQLGQDVGSAGSPDVGGFSEPLEVGPETPWIDVDAGETGTCAIRSGGTLWCWGTGAFLPDYALPAIAVPAYVP